MKRHYWPELVCALTLITTVVACGTKQAPSLFTDKDLDYLPAFVELVEDANAPEEVEALARKIDSLLPRDAKPSTVWKHYTITDTVTLYPAQIMEAFEHRYRAWGWQNGPGEVDMPAEALTGNWMLWSKPSGEVISVTVLIVFPEKTATEPEDEQAAEERQPPAEHLILGRWALPGQD